MRIPVTILLAGLLAAGLTTSVLAGDKREGMAGHGGHHAMRGAGGQGIARFFRKFDLDRDGRVSLAEVRRVTGRRFTQMDANRDDRVSLDELIAYVKRKRIQRRRRMMARIDRNRDGLIDRKEYIAFKVRRARRQFDRLDRNADGVISEREMVQGMRVRNQRMHKRIKRRVARMFRRRDRNRDGLISRRESQTGWRNWFIRMDRNADGIITERELADAQARRHGRRF